MTQKELHLILTTLISFSVFNHKFTWKIFIKGNGFLIQLRCIMADNETGLLSEQAGGKYYISPYAIKDEVVNKAWHACQDFIIHEAREAFKYKKQAIYHPHWKVDQLVKLSKITQHAKRLVKTR